MNMVVVGGGCGSVSVGVVWVLPCGIRTVWLKCKFQERVGGWEYEFLVGVKLDCEHGKPREFADYSTLGKIRGFVNVRTIGLRFWLVDGRSVYVFARWTDEIFARWTDEIFARSGNENFPGAGTKFFARSSNEILLHGAGTKFFARSRG